MATRHVLQSTCDSCHVHAEIPFEKHPRNRKDTFLLPEGWMHIQGNSRTALVFEMDLCQDCSGQVRNMAGRGDIRR